MERFTTAPDADWVRDAAGNVSPNYWYLTLSDATGATLRHFVFPSDLPVTQCIRAAQGLLGDGWALVERDDPTYERHGETQEQITEWRSNFAAIMAR